MPPESNTIPLQAFVMMRQQDALQLARQYKLLLQEAHIPVITLIVFGSAARDEMHEQSDVDVAVVGTSFKGDRMQEMHDIRKLRRSLGYKLQPIWFYPEHLENKYSTLAQEIKKDGIVV